MHCISNVFPHISTVHPGTFPVGHATWSWWADSGARRVEATATYGSTLQMDRGWRWQWPPGKTFCLFMCGNHGRIPFAGRKWFLKKLLVVPSYVWNLPDTCCWATSYVFSTCRRNLSLWKIPRRTCGEKSVDSSQRNDNSYGRHCATVKSMASIWNCLR